jgi:hypothetical protein
MPDNSCETDIEPFGAASATQARVLLRVAGILRRNREIVNEIAMFNAISMNIAAKTGADVVEVQARSSAISRARKVLCHASFWATLLRHRKAAATAHRGGDAGRPGNDRLGGQVNPDATTPESDFQRAQAPPIGPDQQDDGDLVVVGTGPPPSIASATNDFDKWP